jgi:hypothetical protein
MDRVTFNAQPRGGGVLFHFPFIRRGAFAKAKQYAIPSL